MIRDSIAQMAAPNKSRKNANCVSAKKYNYQHNLQSVV